MGSVLEPNTNAQRIFLMSHVFEQIELQAKLLNYFLGSNKSNINQLRSAVAACGHNCYSLLCSL